MAVDLTNFVKYCLGYIKLTRQRTLAAQRKDSVELPKTYFDIEGLLNGELDGSLNEIINLDVFYSLDPKEVTSDKENEYKKQKELANKIEAIYSKHRNNQFTKQVVLNFGFFEAELPIELDENGLDPQEDENISQQQEQYEVKRYPLFSVPVQIEKISEKGVGKYYLFPVDPEVQANVGMLEGVLGEDLYYQIVEEMGRYEIDGRLALPFEGNEVFTEIWHKIKAQLRLGKAKFDENSFHLNEMRLALSPKANFFIAEDLRKIAELKNEDLQGTSLTSWVEDSDLNNETELPQEKDLFFPFKYDKFQLKTLSILGNKASIIQGPPGTGKSETISNILCHLAATGKRVLFVSQKSQALKVVKDKLKKINVPYLFGYIPNPSSMQVNEEDEVDGIAPQLTALESHIERLGYKFTPRKKLVEYRESSDEADRKNLAPIINKKDKIRDVINTTLDNQRAFFTLNNELKELSNFDIRLLNIKKFAISFSQDNWKILFDLQSKIEELKKKIVNYETTDHDSFDKRFSQVDFEEQPLSVAIKDITDDVTKTGYDRHSKILRGLNNNLRSMRLSKIRKKLPRELLDFIDQLLTSDISRNEQAQTLQLLIDYVAYRENQLELKNVVSDYNNLIAECGLSNENFIAIQNLNSSESHIMGVKEKLLRTVELRNEMKKLEKSRDLDELNKELYGLAVEGNERIAQYLRNIINTNILDKYKKGVTIRQITRKLARAFKKSKKAYKTFDRLRKDPDNFNAVLDLMPVWIMELDDASRIIPLEAGIFDYVILDEASQCNVAYTLPVMYRGQHTLFVGDSEQMRDNTILFKSNKAFDELAHRYSIPEELQIKMSGYAVQSVLDIAALRGLIPIPLRYHYRSPAELIGFSNKFFYKPKGKDLIPVNNNYLPFEDTGRVLLIHQIESDWKDEISDKVNVAEAKAILEMFKRLRDDEKYRDKSVGILSFFDAQASFIRELFENEGFNEDENNYKVSIVEGIQGDEKDIILYSFVIRDPDQKNRYTPLTGESGDIRADVNQGRVNVAFS